MAYEIYLKTSSGILKLPIAADLLSDSAKKEIIAEIVAEAPEEYNNLKKVSASILANKNDIQILKTALTGVDELVGNGVV